MNSLNERFKIVRNASIVGIVSNVLLACFKTGVGMMANSIAIIMDGINNFSDATSSLVTLIATSVAGKEPDKKHPFGHGRVEYLSSLLIAGLILYAGMTSLIESVKAIVAKEVSDYSIISLFIVSVAIVGKIALALYTQKKGRQADSDSLVAAGKDSLLDAGISAATLIAALVYIFTKVSIEAWLAAVISLLIIKTGVELLRETISKILGEPAEVELVIGIKKTIASFEGVNGAYDLIINDYGPGRKFASVHIEVDSKYTANEIDGLTRRITDKVFMEHGVVLTGIGLYSKNLVDPEIMETEAEIRKIALACEMVKGMHGFYMNKEEKDIRFDLVISLEKPDRRHYYNLALEEIGKHYPEYSFSCGMDMDFNELAK